MLIAALLLYIWQIAEKVEGVSVCGKLSLSKSDTGRKVEIMDVRVCCAAALINNDDRDCAKFWKLFDSQKKKKRNQIPNSFW